MAVSSMTGFGRAEIDLPGVRLSVEIASVNQKNLQVSVFGPDAWPGLESAASGWIRARLQRGKVTARVTQAAASASTRQWDAEAVAANLDELAKLAARCGVKFSADGELLLRLAESSRRPSVSLPDFVEAEAAVRAAFEEALRHLVAMRLAEGAALAKDLQQRLARMTEMVAGIEQGEQGAPARHRDAMLRRLKEAGLTLDVTDERVLKELALFADRADINEEVVRLRSHLAQFSAEFGLPNVGRKLDFLIQELLREVNTIGSKASEIATTKLVLEAKTEIERIREQVQNLE
ncbi:MAG: YicC/YloC family endoribonuclease [Verrucomicrobiota bacterium]